MCIDITPREYHILKDVASDNKERPWREKKMKSLMISKSYQRLGYSDKAAKVKGCGTFLAFREYANETFKLHSANFCKVRLCSTCSWRRSLKVFGQVSAVMTEVKKRRKDYKDYGFLFLTLTIKNVKGEELCDAITQMMLGYKFLFEQSVVKKNVVGAFRALEVTHNLKRGKSFDTYHPHFHCILMVKKQYFSRNGYISQRLWSTLWQKGVKADYVPIVHIEKIKTDDNNFEHAIAEVAKYSVKDSDILNENEDLQDSTVKVLDFALKGRRLISFRGEFAKIHKELGLDDAIDGDLINTGADDVYDPELDFVLRYYRWNFGYSQFIEVDGNYEPIKDLE